MLAIDGEHPVGHPKDKCWQLQKISCVTFVRSSIVNDVIQTISSKFFFFFLTKKVWAYIKYQNDFQRVRSFCARKKLLPLFFLFRWFIFVCDLFLYAQNFFVICMHLFLFVIICENLFFLWESFWISIICVNLCLDKNKQVYEYHYLKQIFYHQKQIKIFCSFHMFLFYVFCLEFFWVLFC